MEAILTNALAEIRQWLSLGWRAYLTACGALISLVAAIFAVVSILRPAKESNPDGMVPEQRLLRLACGDAKALARLGIQRNWDDQTFFQRLQAQPSYKTLFPHFSDEFRQQLEQFADRTNRRMSLADACDKELERLERKWVTALGKSE